MQQCEEVEHTAEKEIGALIVAGVQGGFFGAIYGGFGYWQLRPPSEPFNGRKLMRAIIVGVLVGIFAAYRGLPLPAAETELHMIAAGAGVLTVGSFIIDQAAGKAWEWVEVRLLKRSAPPPATPT